MSSKKEKRAALKAQTEILNTMRRNVSAAEDNEQILELIPFFKKISKNGIEAEMEFYMHLPQDLLQWAFDLTKKNMEDHYNKTWGWKDGKKMNELKDRVARFFVIKKDGKPIAFVHFRFEFETISQLYVYELQVDPEYQRHGLGKTLLQACELVAMKTGMISVLLTVLKINELAMKFYLRNNYKIHPFSPANADPENVDEYFHEILYKDVNKKPQA